MLMPLVALTILLVGCGTTSTASVGSASGARSPAVASPSLISPVSTGPWPRAANIAYDSTRGDTVLFGGVGDVVNGDTWTWDGHHWTRRSSAANPSVRGGAALTDDPDHQVILLFGGDSSGTPLGDTWLWDGSRWKQAFPAHSPSARTGAALTWDAAHHAALLFGGRASVGFLGDTWTWDGSDWTQKGPSASPPPRAFAHLAFDAARGNVLLFGGFDGMNDTWTWEGATWTQQHPANTPPGLLEATPIPLQMAYDAARKVVVMVDPTAHSADMAANTMDTWTWDGTTWTRQAPAASPPARDGFGLAFDAGRSITILAGGWPFGSADASGTWGWDGSNWLLLG